MTQNEIEIHKKYSARNKEGHVHCDERPLNVANDFENPLKWYATMDEEEINKRGLRRW